MEYKVYCEIKEHEWKATLLYQQDILSIQGEHEEKDNYRNELHATLEVFQFLRKWIPDDASFIIYTNSQYSISCLEKWIPLWIQKGFRINHNAKLRPNTDLLVKLHSFHSCMKIQLSQHYNDFETYRTFF
jgi:ribonuclease HI